EEGVDASSIDLKAGTATVDVTLSAARVGAVLITGNTRTHDIVIRRQLRERPGMLLLTNLVRADFDALTNLGYFEKVEPTVQPGPDPKKPAYVTLVWNVKEKRSGSINLGLGYSGGPNGAGLTGQFGFSNNNISGTGNGASFQYQKGSRALDVAASVTIPYLGDTPRKERYSIGGTLFVQSLTNFYQAYQSSGTQAVAFPPVISTPGPIVPTVGTSTASAGTIPVTLQPNGAPVSGLAADYITRASGVGVTLGRRFTPRLTATAGLNVQRLSSDVNVPLPYFVSGAQPAALANPNLLFNPFGTQQVGNSLGIIAPSIANTINGQSYNLHSVALGLISNTEDNYLDPRHGTKFSLNEEISSHNIGSAFDYTVTTLDFVRFFPILRASTFGIHGEYGTTTGSIPSTKLFILSDQQLRGYRDVFFGTDLILGQAELRVPVSADKKFGLAFFGDYGALRVRDAQPVTDQFGNVLANYSNYIYHGDVGVGIRFDVPQFGLFRLDFAKGKNGTHTSFGIGQSF
ncbi:MAG: BamA/OMP85 family outer membrane protein, partial [Vulcanimicrobiaceae bacterium]